MTMIEIDWTTFFACLALGICFDFIFTSLVNGPISTKEILVITGWWLVSATAIGAAVVYLSPTGVATTAVVIPGVGRILGNRLLLTLKKAQVKKTTRRYLNA